MRLPSWRQSCFLWWPLLPSWKPVWLCISLTNIARMQSVLALQTKNESTENLHAKQLTISKHIGGQIGQKRSRSSQVVRAKFCKQAWCVWNFTWCPPRHQAQQESPGVQVAESMHRRRLFSLSSSQASLGRFWTTACPLQPARRWLLARGKCCTTARKIGFLDL